MIPVASCRTPMSETYDMVKLRWWCKNAVVLDVNASSLLLRDATESADVESRANPKNLEKPIGSTIAWAPVATADIANITLTVLNIGRMNAMLGYYSEEPWVFM